MSSSPKAVEFLEALSQSLANGTFISLTLANYKGQEEGLKNAYIKRVLIKREEKLSFTYRYKTRDIVKNYTLEEGVALISNLLQTGFGSATVFTSEFDGLLQRDNKGNSTYKKLKPTKTEVPSLEHDSAKKRLIAADQKSYLTDLKITDNEGKVFKNAQDKYRQINHYIEILSPLVKEIATKSPLNVVDMGSGKGYLTFALYDYLVNVAHLAAQVTGVEYRSDMVDLCNAIAKKASFNGLNFVQGTIEDYSADSLDVLIALHACDTATDDAIAQGIKSNAELIVVAPCCHKQIRREIEKGKATNDLDFLLKYGIFLERQAEMVTDGIRALVLEYFGYKTKVFEFISDAHTPKNVLVVGVKNRRSTQDRERVLEKIKAAKNYFGIGYHHLERVMGL
jgi:SAM-dependent methyltransferase